MSRRIVIDASVARAAGDGVVPSSKRSRDFLVEVFEICHRVVVTEEIMAEWRRHASRFTVQWLAAMRSRGKVVKVVPGPAALTVADEVLTADDWSVKQAAALEKDLLLITAAVETDRIVASGDGTVRALFEKAARHVGTIARITWVNPIDAEDSYSSWLRAGARDLEDRQLGHVRGAARW
jgi:hypothetical protein